MKVTHVSIGTTSIKYLYIKCAFSDLCPRVLRLCILGSDFKGFIPVEIYLYRKGGKVCFVLSNFFQELITCLCLMLQNQNLS